MSAHPRDRLANPQPSGEDGGASERIQQNVESVADFYTREEAATTRSQRLFEKISSFMGQPLHVSALLCGIVAWIALNAWGVNAGFFSLDPPPFTWLHLAMTGYALFTAIVVLVKQNRFSKLEQQRAHLDLQVNLLAEQKISKLIRLIEELRQDLPSVRNREDPEIEELQEEADPQRVLSAIENQLEVESSRARRN